MDTLFRLVTLQKQPSHHQQPHSFNSTSNFTNTTNSSSSKSSHFTNNYQQNQDQEECFNFFMDEDDFSSSSRHQHHHNQYYSSSHPQPSYEHHQSSNTPTPTTSTTNTPPPLSSHYAAFSSSEHQQSSDPHINYSYSPVHDVTMEYSNSFTTNSWAYDILLDAARAVADKNSARLQQLMWMLNELSSPYGDTDQKLSSYFLQALFARMTESGERSYRTLSSASDKMCSFESTRKLVLKFQEVSPWTTFGHVASNGAIMEAFDGESKLHIIDVSNTFCTQWPTLLEAIATRTDETPHLRITTIVTSKLGGGDGLSGNGVQKVMREIGNRMEKFARLMGVPFKFNVIHHLGDLSDLNFRELGIQDDEALAINLNGTLRSVNSQRRDYLMSTFRSLNPKIITVVDEEADLDIGSDGFEFVRGFQECLRWFRVYFETLDESFPKTSNERLMLERGAGRAIMDLVACTPVESMERRESAARWSSRFHASGFSPVSYSDEVCDDVRALLRRYREGWSMNPTPDSSAGMFLSWKETPVVWASAWKMI
uniref:protein SHORT-ROOT n=1 Tax=Erigeron canadensis TaxID=72917 RepID=UPI001CB96051|nr:protein SHORT-ROOT [Erigeron canadensis]